MKIVAIATRKADAKPEEFAPYLDAEVGVALGMVRDEIVRELYSRADGKGAVIVLECADEAEAAKRLATLPLAKAGLLSFQIFGTKPYRGIVQHAK